MESCGRDLEGLRKPIESVDRRPAGQMSKQKPPE
jgi:hypothetical protein